MSLIDKQLLEKTQYQKQRQENTFYVTNLTTECLRRSYYDLTEPRQYPIETLRIFEAGHILENYWITILKNQPNITILATQLPAYHTTNELQIHGRIDILAQHDNNTIIAHEIKTSKSCHWIIEPKTDHVEQLQFYLNCLKIQHGQIDYLDKEAFLQGEHQIDKNFHIIKNEEIFQKTIEKAYELKKSLDTETPPTPNFNAWNGKICNYCLYNDLCNKK